MTFISCWVLDTVLVGCRFRDHITTGTATTEVPSSGNSLNSAQLRGRPSAALSAHSLLRAELRLATPVCLGVFTIYI